MKFNEQQILKCPSQKSFDEHLLIWEEIRRVVRPLGCQFTWEVLSKKEKTFKLNINAPKTEQMNGLIAVMQLLHSKGIEPAIIVDTKNLKCDEAHEILEDMKEVLHA